MSRKQPANIAVREDRHVTAWAAGALALALFTGIPALASVFAALPLTIRSLRNGPPPTTALVVRWAAMVLFLGTAVTAMSSTRAAGAVATGRWAQRAVQNWISGSGAPVPPVLEMVIVSLLLLVAVWLRRGVAIPIVLAEAILCAGVAAATFYRHAINIFSATVLALPVWTLAWIAGACVLMGTQALANDEARRRAWIVGGSLLAAAVLLRLFTAPLFSQLLPRLTAAP